MKTTKLFLILAAGILSVSLLASCQTQEIQGEAEGEITHLGPTSAGHLIYISQDLETELLMRKDAGSSPIVLPPDSGSFTISAFFREAFRTTDGFLRNDLHSYISDMIGDDFLRLQQENTTGKLEKHYTFEYGKNETGKNRIVTVQFRDDYNIRIPEYCVGLVIVIQLADEND